MTEQVHQKQIRHTRQSKFGKTFIAGSRIPEEEDENDLNILEGQKEPSEDVELLETKEDELEQEPKEVTPLDVEVEELEDGVGIKVRQTED